MRDQFWRWFGGRRSDDNIDDVNVPENPIQSGSPVRDVVCDGVSPGRNAAVSAEELTVACLELDLVAFLDGLPFDGGVETARAGLEDFPAGHAKEEGLVRCGEVLTVATFETDNIVFRDVFNELYGPAALFGGSCPALSDGLFVFVGMEVLPVAALKTDDLGVFEYIH